MPRAHRRDVIVFSQLNCTCTTHLEQFRLELAHNRNVSSTSQFKITTYTLGSLARRSSQFALLSAFTQSQLIAAKVKSRMWPNKCKHTQTHATARLQREKVKGEIDTAGWIEFG